MIFSSDKLYYPRRLSPLKFCCKSWSYIYAARVIELLPLLFTYILLKHAKHTHNTKTTHTFSLTFQLPRHSNTYTYSQTHTHRNTLHLVPTLSISHFKYTHLDTKYLLIPEITHTHTHTHYIHKRKMHLKCVSSLTKCVFKPNKLFLTKKVNYVFAAHIRTISIGVHVS